MEIVTAARQYLIDDENVIATAASSFSTAIDTLFNRKVAVKIISFDKELSERDLNGQLSRAQNEISVLSDIGNMTSHVPYLLDKWFDNKNRKLYIFMQWINGDTLRKKMDGFPKKPKDFLGWMISLADLLGVMEKKRYYHNDIKPENIMFDKNNKLFLIDFNLTVSNKTMHEGTPHYIAPELTDHIQARKDKADMFSLGVMMYEYFTDTLPTRGTHYGMKRRLFGDSKALKSWDVFKAPIELNESLNPKINELIVRLMNRIPTERFNSYDALKKELINVKKAIR